jgi:hypothetical protein
MGCFRRRLGLPRLGCWPLRRYRYWSRWDTDGIRRGNSFGYGRRGYRTDWNCFGCCFSQRLPDWGTGYWRSWNRHGYRHSQCLSNWGIGHRRDRHRHCCSQRGCAGYGRLSHRPDRPVTVTGTANVFPTGVQATGQIGTATVSADSVPVTGVEATGAVGTVTVAAGATAVVSGVQATGQIGTVTVTGTA